MSTMLLALCLVCFQDAKAASDGTIDERGFAAQVDAIGKRALEDGVPALSIAVARGGELFVARGFGWSDAASTTPASEKTSFAIGSLTRQFTAVAVLRLADEKKLALDDELSKHLPAFPGGKRKITLRNLLSNTSGIPGYRALREKHPGLIDEPMSEDRFFALFSDVPFAFEPGTGFGLDSADYVLLSMIVGKVSGQPFEDYVREQLLKPLGLSSTHFCPSEGAPVAYFAPECDAITDVNDLEIPLAAAPKSATQSLCSNVIDLLAWNRALFERALLSEVAAVELDKPGVLSDGRSTNYGFSMAIGTLDKYAVRSHTGGIGGFRVRLAYYPQADVSIVVLANCVTAQVEELEREIARRLLGLSPMEVVDLELPGSEMLRYAGIYQLGTTMIEIREREGKLWYEAPGEAPTRLLAQTTALFVRDNDRTGRVRFHVHGERAESFELMRGGFTTSARRIP